MGRIPWAAPAAVDVVIPWRILEREHKTNIGRSKSPTWKSRAALHRDEMWAKGLSYRRVRSGKRLLMDAPH